MMRTEPNEHDEWEDVRIRQIAIEAGFEKPDAVVLGSIRKAHAHARALTARLPRDLGWSDEPGWTPADRPESERSE